MLRMRLYLGLLPLLFLVIAMGAYAIHVCRDLAGSLLRDLAGNYRAIVACHQMRESARQMYAAISPAQPGPSDQRAFDDARAAFARELMAQSAASAGTPRADFVEAVDRAFGRLAVMGERTLRDRANGDVIGIVQARSTALGSVLDAIENLTRRDFAVAQQTAARVTKCGLPPVARHRRRVCLTKLPSSIG